LKAFDFVNFEKIRETSKKLSLYGIYGLHNDVMLENDLDMNADNFKHVK
jgi:hypothetical protein